MISKYKKIYCSVMVISLALMVIPQAPVHAAINNWQKGGSIQSQWDGDFDSPAFKQSVDNLASTHANYVSLVFRIYQSTTSSTDIQAGRDTPTDQALADAIDYVHSKGMHAMIKPHLESFGGEWRATINPPDRGTWFANYGQFMAHYGSIAQAHGAEDFCIGTELIDMSTASVNGTNTQNWINLINHLRTIFTGRLTYGANWGGSAFADEKNNIQFWNALDYIGISTYFNLNSDNSIAGLESAWDSYNKNDIGPLSSRWGKPVVFTEVGYKSVTGSHTQPWNYFFGSGYDGVEQSNDYKALFDYWQNYPFMQGVELWEWRSDPNAGGPGNGDYTPQHKPAQDIMTTWFNTGAGSVGGNNTTTFAVSANATPVTVSAGQATAITATVIANNGTAAGIVVDVEIYNSVGQQVKQQVFQNQTFSNGQTKTYNIAYVPPVNDAYKVKIGVFNFSWSQLYIWNDSAAVFGFNGGPGPTPLPPPNPPPVNSAIDVWWPTAGSHVGGNNVPFKALLKNWDVANYNMYWQVDGGGLVLMPTDIAGYPHKEFDADLTSWTWKGSGPYRLNFVAKDKNSTILAQQGIDIIVGP